MEADCTSSFGILGGDFTCSTDVLAKLGMVPGVDELTFPSPDAFADAMTLSGSWFVPLVELLARYNRYLRCY